MAPSVLVQIDRVLENVRALTKAVETENAKDSDGGYFEAYEALVEQCSTMDAIEVHLRDIGYPDSDPVLVDSTGLRKSPFRYRKPNAIFDTGKLVGGNALEMVRFFRLIEQGLLKARSAVAAAEAKNREMMPLTKAQSIFGFTSRKALTCFLNRHPEVGQDKPLTKAGKPNQRRRRVDVLALCEAISRTDAIMSDPVRRAQMESRLQKAQLNKKLEANALAYLTGKAK